MPSGKLFILSLLGLVVWAGCVYGQDEEGGVDEDGCPEFVCPEDNGNFADPCQCRRFYICASGIPTKSLCPTGLYWDDVKLFCNFKDQATCGPVERKKKVDVPLIPKCDPAACQLPYCFCSKSGDVGPLGADAQTKDIPQVVALMFDGAINTNNFNLYKSLLSIKRNNNSNECSVRGTFFMLHNYNNYHQTEYFYSKGHEIAISSVTGESLQYSNESDWRLELTRMREMLAKYASIPPEDILGVRAPRFRPGFDEQFKIVVEEGFVWDSSVTTKVTDRPIWPYTLDYRIPHKCKVESCPKKSYPGLWEIPANLHYVEDQSGGSCSYLDQCIFAHFDENDVFNWLKEDFLRFYESNRAPYTMPFHTNWFTHPHQVKGLEKFVRWTLEKPDVYYLTATEVLLWMSDPKIEVLKELVGQCNDLGRDEPCRNPTTCKVAHTDKNGISEFRYMATCADCPIDYPWITNNE